MSLKSTQIVKTAICPKVEAFLGCCNLESQMSKEAEILTACISCHDTQGGWGRGVMYPRCVSLTRSDS